MEWVKIRVSSALRFPVHTIACSVVVAYALKICLEADYTAWAAGEFTPGNPPRAHTCRHLTKERYCRLWR